MPCQKCNKERAVVLRTQTQQRVCKNCFQLLFESEIHTVIHETNMFRKGERVGIGVSGGKDSTVLLYVLDKLNKRYGYGLDLVMLCVDEGIAGYRDHSIETVLQNQEVLKLPLKILSYEQLFGISMDQVVEKIGLRGNCSYCGVFRRQALEEAARRMGADCIVTGHNADDMAETVLLNLIRGDTSRLRRCTQSRTPSQLSDDSKVISVPRCKPFKRTYQKEIVLYAYFNKLPYFSTECTYAPNAARGDVREFIGNIERVKPGSIANIIRAAEELQLDGSDTVAGVCKNCANPTSSSDKICSACRLLIGLGVRDSL